VYLLSSGPRKSVHEPVGCRTGYGHNFGEVPGGGPGVQGQIIVQILKPLLDKCVQSRKELYAHENIVSTYQGVHSNVVYCASRVKKLLIYISEFLIIYHRHMHGCIEKAGNFPRLPTFGLTDALRLVENASSDMPHKQIIRANIIGLYNIVRLGECRIYLLVNLVYIDMIMYAFVVFVQRDCTVTSVSC